MKDSAVLLGPSFRLLRSHCYCGLYQLCNEVKRLQDKTITTIDAYNQSFRAYADKFMQYAPYVLHVTEFADFLECGSKVLDIGCGPGNVARQLCAVKQCEITGIDLSADMLEMAKTMVPDGKFYIQDIRSASFPLSCYDAVVLAFSIVHLNDDEAFSVLNNAAKWLKTGGYLYVSFMEGKLPGFETTSFSTEPLYFNYFPGSVVEAHLQANGVDCFRSVRQEYLESDGTKTTEVFVFGKKRV